MEAIKSLAHYCAAHAPDLIPERGFRSQRGSLEHYREILHEVLIGHQHLTDVFERLLHALPRNS